jgi:hypothetical protein
MPEIKKDVARLMSDVRKKRLPSSEVIVGETFKRLGYAVGKFPPEYFRENFNKVLNEVWTETLDVLESYEERVYPGNVIDALMEFKAELVEESKKVAQQKGFTAAARHLFTSFYPYLREVFLSISQSRKTRGGRDFELQFGKLLDLMNVPYQKIKRAYRVDFMIPSDDMFHKNPTAAAIASAKRTLRERWREVVEELHDMRSPNIFLITADRNVTTGHVNSICGNYRIHLVVWDDVKLKYTDEPLVLGYSEWANKRLPILSQFW